MFLLTSWDVLYKNFFGRTPKRLPKEAFWQFSTDFRHIFVNLGVEWSLVRLTTKVLPQERHILTNRISILKKNMSDPPPNPQGAVIGLICGKFERFLIFLANIGAPGYSLPTPPTTAAIFLFLIAENIVLIEKNGSPGKFLSGWPPYRPKSKMVAKRLIWSDQLFFYGR